MLWRASNSTMAAAYCSAMATLVAALMPDMASIVCARMILSVKYASRHAPIKTGCPARSSGEPDKTP